MQRLHDNVNGNLQKFTITVNEINKSRDIFLTKILGIFAVSLNPIIIQNWKKRMLVKRQTIC